MRTKLVIGCKRCEMELKRTKGFSLSTTGELQLPFPIQTEFNRSELNELYSNPFTCPFCNNSLEMTPRMLKFIVSFFDKMFHVEVVNGFIEVSNGELSFAIPVHTEVHSVKAFLAQSGLVLENADDYLPTVEDIRFIQDAVKEYDHQNWTLRIESGLALQPYISSQSLWFNDLPD
jgi:hypothetical protein